MRLFSMKWLLTLSAAAQEPSPKSAVHSVGIRKNSIQEVRMNTVTSESIVRLSKIIVDPERLPEYLAFAAECGRQSMEKEPGVLMMYSMQDKAHPERITILEIYADRNAYERHIQTPHFRKYKQGTLDMVRKLELLDQTPLIPEMKMK